jgi:protein-tyrosine phosphatase
MRIYWINTFEKGNIGMMARPKGNDWLEDEIRKLSMSGVNMVVSLLEKHEEVELEIEKESELCQKHNIEYVNFPIKDRGVPENVDSFLKLISTIDQNLRDDKKIAIHCRMGIGRTSVVAAGTLIKNGHESEGIFEFLSEKRTLTVPDTDEQIEWIKGQKHALQQKIKKHRADLQSESSSDSGKSAK